MGEGNIMKNKPTLDNQEIEQMTMNNPVKHLKSVQIVSTTFA